MTTHTAVRVAQPLLDSVGSPDALRSLSPAQLKVLSEEIRAFLIDTVTSTGGHLGPNLGVVELTVALHRVFDSPRDTILFDTGHQTYVHKLLTGRKERFTGLRQGEGISGYPSRAESPHDFIENSHASTALSYADGLAKAFALAGTEDRKVVAVVGDGSLTGGMSFEALNNIGTAPERPVIVVLNDNGRSYEPTVGVFGTPWTGGSAAPPDAHCRTLAELFGALGLDYLGPVDGHDIEAVEAALRKAVATERPVVVHCRTVKGKGYAPAEEDEADCLHAVGVVDRETGKPHYGTAPSWTTVFADEIRTIGAEREDVVCLTGAMLRPTGLLPFAQDHPGRVFDVGLAEQHAVASAAGLATGGMHPVVAVYATFLNRAFDQVLMDVALHRLPVTFVLDRAGVTGPDGPSHHGVWDSSLLSLVPGLRLAAPRDPVRLRELLREAVSVHDGPTAVRFPKASAGPDIPAVQRVGNTDILHRRGAREVLVVTAGPLARSGLEAARSLHERNIGVTVADPRWVHPLDPALLQLAGEHRLVVTVEDNIETAGLGSRIAHALSARPAAPLTCTLSLPPAFVPHDTREAILRRNGLDGPGIADAVLRRLRDLGVSSEEAHR
ncbi:1-deoxy-D-xylulose-5-phosphate synthase [Streptomyces rimosus subsp. pseudoverticillatus]|uniref:1-deoxy-D-xylulose-5-phosphate synthase n=1 Tax=Streptomyces rimosus TaxID=1927 RepID=UPI0006B25B63|nr:1-deoxy-D-xylulose-5-phosphate synthase [Streptomyces rimosus]KOT97717.1 1-deoxy-D-xylulose-5-phosphate synthase [Streptomyces rimosus subsp. pseudoverticillatus]